MGQANTVRDVEPGEKGFHNLAQPASLGVGANCFNVGIRNATTSCMLTLTHQSTCITVFIRKCTGNHVSQDLVERPVRLDVGREKPGEGNPDDPGQARSQMSEHVKVAGLLLVSRGHVPTHMPSQTAPQVITHWNVEGAVVCWTA